MMMMKLWHTMEGRRPTRSSSNCKTWDWRYVFMHFSEASMRSCRNNHAWEGNRLMMSWKKCAFRPEFFLVAKSANDCLYKSSKRSTSFRLTKILATYTLHKLSTERRSDECVFLACVCRLVAITTTCSASTSVGTSFALLKRDRRMPLALSASWRSSCPEPAMMSTKGVIKRRTSGLECCFFK